MLEFYIKCRYNVVMNTYFKSKIEAVDLFCGVGGLTHGLNRTGISVKAGYDIEESCRFAFEFNNEGAQFFNKDVQELTANEILSHYSEGAVRLLAGCAPCQPFSTYSQGRDVKLDKKWPLLYAFARLIKETSPDLVTMENVPDVTKHKVYHDFVDSLLSQGYEVWADTVLCAEYGLPQMRRRHVLLASRIRGVTLLNPTHKDRYVTVADVIADLPVLRAGEKHPEDPLHRASALNKLNMERIRSSKPGGTWRDWPEELVAKCHLKETGATYGGVYGRMEWDKPAPTITTQCFGYGNGRFGHPEQDRAISLREAAILQSFPDHYQFWPNPNFTMKSVGRMIGNAVPVKLGEIIGMSFRYSLDL